MTAQREIQCESQILPVELAFKNRTKQEYKMGPQAIYLSIHLDLPVYLHVAYLSVCLSRVMLAANAADVFCSDDL